MANLIDYLKWRGDLPLSVKPFGELDALLLCELSHLPIEGLGAEALVSGALFNDIAKVILEERREGIIRKGDIPLLQELTGESCVRYASLRIYGYTVIIDPARETQFCAMVFKLDKTTAVVFRGTDRTIAGFKEDMNLAYETEVPAQAEAVSFINKIAAAFRGPLIVMGHSKGGNLAVYGSAFCKAKTRKRIETVYNFDGPGFNEKIFEKEEFREIAPKVITFVPQSSLVGTLLEPIQNHIVIRSDSRGLWQHFLLSWQVEPGGIVRETELSQQGKRNEAIISEWVKSMSYEEKEEFVDIVFDFFGDNQTVDDLIKWENIIPTLKILAKLDRTKRKKISAALNNLREAMIDNMKNDKAAKNS